MPRPRTHAGRMIPTGVIAYERILLAALASWMAAAGVRADVIDVPTPGARALADGEVIVRGPWGKAPGEFGRDDEASRPGPMDFVATGDRLFVLDPVNARVQVFRYDGAFERQIDIGTQTADFLAVGPDGDVAVLDAFARRELRIFSADGALHTRSRIPDDIKLPSALALDGQRVLIEDRHDRVHELNVAKGLRGETATAVRTFAGRPSESGAGLLHAHKSTGGDVALQAPLTRSTGAETTLRFPSAVRTIVALESDAAGRVYLAVTCPIEGDANPWHSDIVLAVISADGTVASTLRMPNRYATDHYRKLALDASGDVIQMQTTEDEVRFVRWAVEPSGEKGGAR